MPYFILSAGPSAAPIPNQCNHPQVESSDDISCSRGGEQDVRDNTGTPDQQDRAGDETMSGERKPFGGNEDPTDDEERSEEEGEEEPEPEEDEEQIDQQKEESEQLSDEDDEYQAAEEAERERLRQRYWASVRSFYRSCVLERCKSREIKANAAS